MKKKVINKIKEARKLLSEAACLQNTFCEREDPDRRDMDNFNYGRIVAAEELVEALLK